MPRVYIKGVLYYITSRGSIDEELFKDPQDYKTYLDFLKEYKEQYKFKLYAFCLLPQHLHLRQASTQGHETRRACHLP